MARVTYLTDTHAILWHLFITPRRLGPAAQVAFAEADAGQARIIVPAVVVAEMIAVVERGRLPGVTVVALLTQLHRMQYSANYWLLALRPATVIASHTLTAIPDIFDRLIVAEARRLGLPLITRDQGIRASNLVTVVW